MNTIRSGRGRKKREQEVPDWLTERLQGCATSVSLADALRETMEKDLLPSGARLPSIRRFQGLTGLRHHEVCQALETLATEARIEQRRGAGTFVANGTTARLTNDRATFKIGIVPPSFDPRLTHPGAALCQAGIAMAADLNFRLQIVPPRIADEMPMGFLEHIKSLRLDGLIWIQPPVFPPPALIRLLDARIPVVLTGRSYPFLPVKSVTWNYAALAATIVEYMVAKRRSKLIAMVGLKGDTYSDGPVDAIRAALQAAGLDLPESHVVTNRTGSAAHYHSITLREDIRAYFERNQDFDTVFSLYPDHLDVLDEMHAAGIKRCPADFLHLHFCSTNKWSGQRWPSFPTAYIEAPPEAVGRQAVRELERLLGVPSEEEDVELSPKIVHDPYVLN